MSSVVGRIIAAFQSVAADIKSLRQIAPTCLVNFNGSGSTPTIRWGYNVASITKVSTGRYRVNFTTQMANINYVVAGSPTSAGLTDANGIVRARGGGMTVDYVEIVTGPGGVTSLSDYDTISVMIFGGR
ncbi:hypothetical protein [Aquitalea palustris]|nr:hypothetical protein [Aquitalea palustris]